VSDDDGAGEPARRRYADGVEHAGVIAPRAALPQRLWAGLALVLVGLASWALYAVAAGRANTAYHPNGAPPQYVRLVGGHTYWIAVPDGIHRLRAAGLDPSKVICTAGRAGEAPGPLAVAAVVNSSTDDSKFVDRIGSFIVASTGRYHVECTSIGTVYVENAADGGFDWSGLWLVLASGALVVGLPLVLSGLRRPRQD